MTAPDAAPAARAWDTYWRGTQDASAYSSGGIDHPAIRAFWAQVFAQPRSGTPRILDIAGGRGAVLAYARAAFGGRPIALVSADISPAAVAHAASQFHSAGVVADARALPFPSRSFALVTSQFGVEYAGADALLEASRLPARGGTLALLLHSSHSGIHRECAASLDAIERLQRVDLIGRALGQFSSDAAAAPGSSRLLPAFRELEALMREHGRHVAGDTVLRLYNDLARMQRDPHGFDRGEVRAWLHTMDGELEAYRRRMASMCSAALSDKDFERFRMQLRDRDYSIRFAGALDVPQAPPLGWALIADSPGA